MKSGSNIFLKILFFKFATLVDIQSMNVNFKHTWKHTILLYNMGSNKINPTDGYEISILVHIPLQQYLVFWKRCQHIYWEGIDCNWQIVDQMKIWSHSNNKTGMLPLSDYVGTTLWCHYVDFNETHREKATREINKKVTRCYKKNPGSSTPQNNMWFVIFLTFYKTYMLVTAGKVWANIYTTFFS